MKYFVSWDEVNQFIDKIAEKYEDCKISGVYGIPRGGLVFAVMLSYKMNIPLLAAPTNDCIIIDDIADSGDSLIHYANHRYDENKYHIVTMYMGLYSSVIPELYVKVKDEDWIVFPWEVNK